GDEHPCLLLCPWPSRSALCGSHPRIYVGPRPRSRGGDRSGSGGGLLGARAAVPLGALIARAGGTGGPGRAHGSGRPGRAGGGLRRRGGRSGTGLAQLVELVLQVAGEPAAVVLLEGAELVDPSLQHAALLVDRGHDLGVLALGV